MNQKILSIDDSKTIRLLLARMLRPFQVELREAGNGEEGLAQAKEVRPDLIILDYNMPVMDGLEFLKHVRAEHGPSQPVVVLCTTEAGIDRIVEALAAGAQEYIMKPFDAGILHDKFVQAGLLKDAA